MKKMNKAIDDVLEFMEKCEPDSEEYSKAARNLKELCEAKGRLSPELLAVLAIVVPAVTSVLGIVLILNYEQLNVVTTKALGFVVKGRL
jgi:hypothetical protein